MSRTSLSAGRVVGIYVVISALWIMFSDSFLESLTHDEALITQIQTYKGMFFVTATGIFLFFLLKREFHLRERSWVVHEKEKNELLLALETKNRELLRAYDATIEGWAKALELRDREVKNHSARVTNIAVVMAKAYQFTDEQMIHMRRGALLHDIGKMAIPDAVLLKNGPLNSEERKIIQKHVEYGVEMISAIQYLEPALDILRYHHEKWEGDGYPFHLKAEQIPLSARIFAVADVWDALTSDRPYRLALGKEKALEILQEQAGRHFDPKVIDMFLSLGIPDLVQMEEDVYGARSAPSGSPH